MRVAVLSDIHDHLSELGRALQKVADCQVLLFCGDLCAPFTLREIVQSFPGPIHTVLGNNDGDPLLMHKMTRESGRVTIHGDYAELELAGRRIAVVHYPLLAEGLAALGHYDLVCHGHDHRTRLERRGKTLLLDPGDVMGWQGRPTCAVYDTEFHKAEILDL